MVYPKGKSNERVKPFQVRILTEIHLIFGLQTFAGSSYVMTEGCGVALAYTFQGFEAAAQVYCANYTSFATPVEATGLAADDAVR